MSNPKHQNKGITMQILRESFEETMKSMINELNRNEYMKLEQESNEKNDNLELNQEFKLQFEENLTSTVTLEDELSTLNATLILNNNNEVTIANQKVTFKVTNTTISPYLGTVKLKGKIKRAFISKIVDFNHYERVTLYDKAFLKYTFQYGTMSIEYFTNDISNLTGFFKMKKTSLINKKHFRKYPKTYTYEESSKIDATMFPSIEEDAATKAEELIEELENLAYRSNAVAVILRDREIDQSYRIKQLEERIKELENK